MSKTVAYARTSTTRQDLGIEVQLEAFEFYKPEIVFKEQESGRKTDRPELNKALAELREGDTLLIYRIDRLSRSMRQLINVEAELREKGIRLKIIHENIDTHTAMGRLVFAILASIAEMESENTSIRTKAALKQAKKKGIKLGNKHLDKKLEDKILSMVKSGSYTYVDIADKCKVSLKTVYNVRKRNNVLMTK